MNSLVLALAICSAGVPQLPESTRVDFARDIQPILEQHCYSCHDGRKRTAGLRLDIRASAFRGGESGAVAIEPGDAAASSLLQRVSSRDPDERMPPKGARLSEDEIDLLRRWIAEGAAWPNALAGQSDAVHWAFEPPRKTPLPNVEQESWIRNEIDRFVLARLEREGLTPSEPADRVTLLRRLSLDLIGLPPTIAEIEAFLADGSDAAYDHAVERLLRSPHYGEKWGRHWLDAARYADSDGYEKDKPRQVWFYRDWVVAAFNRDLPYDQFIIEQLAGDLLPDATQDQLVATGFLRNSMINEEGGVDPEQFRMEAMFDRMDAVGKAILGLTIQCGQCHNHKYDPLTQEEYYRIFAILNNDHEASMAVYTMDQQRRRAGVLGQIREIETRLQLENADWMTRLAGWEANVRDDQVEWASVMPFLEDLTTGGQKYLPQPDGSLLAQSYAPTRHVANFRVQTELETITAFRLELLNDPNLPLSGPGRSVQGTAALTEFDVQLTAPGAQPIQIKIGSASADINLPEKELAPIYDDRSSKRRVTGPIGYAIDDDDLTAWGIDAGPGRRNLPRQAVFVPETPVQVPAGAILTIQLSQRHGGWNSDDNQNHNLGRFRISVTDASHAAADPIPRSVRQILGIPVAQRKASERAAVFGYWRTTVDEWAEANQQIEELWAQHPEPSSQLVLQQRDRVRATSLLRRGDFLAPVSAATPGTPAFLHSFPPHTPVDRLSFAKWLVDRRAPTTARAIVNRVWQHHFGTGLVSTSEDLGRQSEPPTHPQLLDWLSVEFMDRGWSIKHLHRLIVHSATYRQLSRMTAEQYSRDPYNRLLARGARFRADAEVVRDIALAASGLLNAEVGGPSVHPPVPAYMFQPPVSYGPKTWIEDTDNKRFRRALYTFRFRSIPYPALESFDAPNGDFACVRRSRSNTPLQALTTLNEPIFMECSQALALRTLRAGNTTDEERLAYAFRLCVARHPQQDETAVLLALLDEQRKHLMETGGDPWELAAADPENPPELPPDTTAADLAAWTTVARVLLNLDETITRE